MHTMIPGAAWQGQGLWIIQITQNNKLKSTQLSLKPVHFWIQKIDFNLSVI